MPVWGDIFDKYRRRGYDLSMCAHKADVITKGKSEDKFNIRVELMPDNYWYAYDDDRYDAEVVDGEWQGNHAKGTGLTKFEAIRELIERLEEND